jgi:hypothetical protein
MCSDQTHSYINIGYPIYLNAYVGRTIYRVSNMNTECKATEKHLDGDDSVTDDRVSCSMLPASSIVCSEYGNPEKWTI